MQKIVKSRLDPDGETDSAYDDKGWIEQFEGEIRDGKQLAVDQLLNAVFLATSNESLMGDEEVKQAIFKSLAEGTFTEPPKS